MMTLSARNHRLAGMCCFGCCGPLATNDSHTIKATRRLVKRRERQAWKKEVRSA